MISINSPNPADGVYVNLCTEDSWSLVSITNSKVLAYLSYLKLLHLSKNKVPVASLIAQGFEYISPCDLILGINC